MKAVLLAAGKGNRLKPLTNKIPKVMIPINGKPILEYHIIKLAEAGIKDIFINLYHFPEKITEYFVDGKRWDVNITYAKEDTLLGTGGAVYNLKKYLKEMPFLVAYGDNYLDIDYRDFIKYSDEKGGIGSIVVFKKKDLTGAGIVDFGKDMRVHRFKEKPRKSEVFSHWINAGVYFFTEKIFKYIGPGVSDFGFDIIPSTLKNNEKLFVYKLKDKVWGIDSLELLAQLKSEISVKK